MNEQSITVSPERLGVEIRELTRQAKAMTVYYAVEIGRRLTAAKSMVPHGGWAAGTLGSDGLKPVTLDLNGGKLGESTDNISIIVKNGASPLTGYIQDGSFETK